MRKLLVLSALVLTFVGADASFARADWAIALGQSGSDGWAYGTAWNYSSSSEARRKAMANCRDRGPNCKIIGEGSGQCVALAIGRDDNAWGWAQRDTKRLARQAALDGCNDKSDGTCKVQDVFCDE